MAKRSKSLRSGSTIVTGATGFAGQHLLDRLPADANVVGWNRPGGTPADTSRPVIWRGVDITDRESVIREIKKSPPSRVFHVAGAPSVESSWHSVVPHMRINVLGTRNLLDAVRLAGRPCRVLVVSSAQVYRMTEAAIDENAPLVPHNPYGVTKLAQDQLASFAAGADGLDVMIARPFNHIGPRQAAGFAVSSFARQIARIELGQEPPVLRVGNLETRRDMTDVRDVVDAYVRIMEHGQSGRAYNVCSGRAWRIRDLLDALLRLSTVKIEVENDPARMRPVDIPVVQGDASRLQGELNWSPRIAVEDTLRDTLEWWRTQVRAAG